MASADANQLPQRSVTPPADSTSEVSASSSSSSTMIQMGISFLPPQLTCQGTETGIGGEPSLKGTNTAGKIFINGHVDSCIVTFSMPFKASHVGCTVSSNARSEYALRVTAEPSRMVVTRFPSQLGAFSEPLGAHSNDPVLSPGYHQEEINYQCFPVY